MTLHTELTRYKVKKGKEDRAREWMRFLNENIGETLLTLKNERMYVENIFSEVIDGQMYLYWFSYQGDDAQAVEESESWIDKKHLEYWDECLVWEPEDHGEDLSLEVSMVEPSLSTWIEGQSSSPAGIESF